MNRSPMPDPGRRALVAALAASPLLLRAQDFSRVEVRAEQLSPTTWVLFGAGGNLALNAGPDTVFLVDDQYAPMVPKIRAAIAKITPAPVRFVLNTHFHFDHTGGNEAFAEAGALIVAHDRVRERMSADQLIRFAGGSGQTTQPKAGPKALPVVTVPGEVTFHINGEQVHAFHVPAAHTDGDLIVHFRGSDVVHMGDVFFNGMYPFIDLGSGGSVAGTIAAFDRVLAISGEKTRIIPGHGPLATKADAQAMRDMIATVAERVRAARAAGKSTAEIRAGGLTTDFDERYGRGFVKPEAFVQQLVDGMR